MSQTFCSIADIMYGSGKTTFGRRVIPTARAALRAWVDVAKSANFTAENLSEEDQNIIKRNLLQFTNPRKIAAVDLNTAHPLIVRNLMIVLLERTQEFDQVLSDMWNLTITTDVVNGHVDGEPAQSDAPKPMFDKSTTLELRMRTIVPI